MNPSVGILLGNARQVGTAIHVDLMTQSSARDAIDALGSQLTRVTTELGLIGSNQSRLSYAANALASSRENYLAAASRIMDVDVAEESANLVSIQVRQQAGVAILAQANQQPALILSLLQ